MKKATLMAAGLLVVAVLALSAYAAQQEKGPANGKSITLTGKVSCSFCKLAHPDRECPPNCCVECVKSGNPPLLNDKDGSMYLLINGEIKKPLITKEREALVGKNCTVKGLLVKGKGVQAIFVDTIELAG